MLKLQKVENFLLFLTLLFLPTQLGKHFWPNFSYIYSLKIDYLSPTLYFWDILSVALLTLWFLRKPKINKLALNLLLLFLFTQALSLFKTQNLGAGLVRLQQYTISGLFGVYIASLDFKDLPKKISLPLSLAVLGESFLAILQFIKGSTLGFWILGERSFSILTPGISKFDYNGYQFLRPYATFPHPNVLAAFMLLSLFILSFWGGALAAALESLKKDSGRTGFARKIHLLTYILGGLTILLTVSRTVILAGLVTLPFFVKKRSLIWAVLLVLILSPVLFTRFSSLLNFDNLTLLRREELVGSAWEIFTKSPFLGVGLNNFISAVSSNLVTGPSRFLQPVHNIFLLSLAETGIVGFMGFIVLIGWPIRFMVYRLWFIDKAQSAIKIYDIRYTILPWLIIIFLGMFDHYFLTLPQGYRLLFLIWGLSLARFQKLL